MLTEPYQFCFHKYQVSNNYLGSFQEVYKTLKFNNAFYKL